MATVLRAQDLVRECKVLGKTLVFGRWLIALKKAWSNEASGYEHSACLYRWLTSECSGKDPVSLMVESDVTFSDEGHAARWVWAGRLGAGRCCHSSPTQPDSDVSLGG